MFTVEAKHAQFQRLKAIVKIYLQIHNQHKMVFTLFMIGWKHLGGTQWLQSLVNASIMNLFFGEENDF